MQRIDILNVDPSTSTTLVIVFRFLFHQQLRPGTVNPGAGILLAVRIPRFLFADKAPVCLAISLFFSILLKL